MQRLSSGVENVQMDHQLWWRLLIECASFLKEGEFHDETNMSGIVQESYDIDALCGLHTAV